jgi:hypothetical protein
VSISLPHHLPGHPEGTGARTQAKEQVYVPASCWKCSKPLPAGFPTSSLRTVFPIQRLAGTGKIAHRRKQDVRVLPYGKQNIWSLSAMELHDSSGNLVLHCTPPPFAPAQPPPRLLPSASAHIQEEGAS